MNYKGFLRIIILKKVFDNNEIHAYDIIAKVKSETNNSIAITCGAIYPVLHSLEKNGILVSRTELKKRRVRRYYKLSKLGLNSFKLEIKETLRIIHQLQDLLKANTL